MKIRFLFLIFQFPLRCLFAQTAESRIDSLLKWYYPPAEPGAVVAVMQHDKIIYEKSYGLADLTTDKPIHADDNFNIGSLTKQFTAYALLNLCYEGKCSLSDSIGIFFSLPAPLAGIRISQLLNQSSGIPDHYGFTDTFKIKHATDKDVLTALQRADTTYFTSGTHYRYSNTGYCLLGLLIEKLSGLSYEAFLQQNIFAPLEIHDARVFRIDELIPRRVIGYEKTKDGRFVKADAEESIFYSTEADGGIYISMNNYLKWCRAIVSGKFSGTAVVRKAWEAQTPVDSLHRLWYGCGWFVSAPAGTPEMIYHTGFNGGFRTVAFLIPSLDYCVSIFSNRGDIDLETLVAGINQILSIPDNSFIKSGPLESFIHSWPKFAPCKETSSFSTSFKKNLNAKGMVLN